MLVAAPILDVKEQTLSLPAVKRIVVFCLAERVEADYGGIYLR
jgi:hypothetical protein